MIDLTELLSDIFPWNDNLSTGIEEIDQQHQRLVQLINLLAYQLVHCGDKAGIDKIFAELTDYTLYHFSTEESIWGRYLSELPEEQAHRESHVEFVQELLALKAQEDHRELDDVVEDLLSMLTHWLAYHILENDRRLAQIVLALRAGDSLADAQITSQKAMTGSARILIDTILQMYKGLSTRSLQLMREIVQRQKAEAKLKLAANVLENTFDRICITDVSGHIIEHNPAFIEYFNININHHQNLNTEWLQDQFDDVTQLDSINRSVNERGYWSGEVTLKDGQNRSPSEWLTISSIKNNEGIIVNYIWVFSNVSQLLSHQQNLKRQATHDSLTGLLNRRALKERLELGIAYAERAQQQLAVCYLDLDGFKPINDRYGHAVGDQLLRTVASRLKNALRKTDAVARVGGDEFVLLLNFETGHFPFNTIEQILELIASPISIDENVTVAVTGSIGVAIYPQDNHQGQTLLHHADQAMYQAKNAGKSQYSLYSPIH